MFEVLKPETKLFACREEIAQYDKLKKHYEDPTFEVVSGVFRGLSKKKIIGSGSFQRHVLNRLCCPLV